MSDLINPSNAITIIYGISGVGKSRQADEAAEYVYETYGKLTRMYVSDLGGWGTKRLSLIKLGIVQVWYFVNHLELWATAELASLGYWPESFLNKETGMATLDVPLVGPRQLRWVIICPQGHSVVTLYAPPVMIDTTCPTCQVATSLENCLRIDKQVIRTQGFKDIGLYVYDSLTQLNEAGLERAAEQGAGMSEGDALRSPAGVVEGRFTFGLNQKNHYGFLQQRSRGWIRNIRTIPDQVERAIVTCGVEMGKGDDESGGIPIYGPKIAGNARTSSVPGWAGNCLHVTKETPIDGSAARHRIWLVNHTDTRDPRMIPYLAKHRGEPADMPQYLEDASDAEFFSTCSMKEFYRLEKQQLTVLLERDRAKFPVAPGIDSPVAPEEVLESEQVVVPSNGQPVPIEGQRRRRAVVGADVVTPTSETVGGVLEDPTKSISTIPRLRRVRRPSPT